MKEIQLSRGKVAIVDDEDFEYLSQFRWFCTTSGYAIRNQKQIKRKRFPQIAMHREIMDAPKGMEVDHVNGDKLDNRKENLRVVTRTQNMWNRPSQRDCATGYKGAWLSKTGRYESSIVFDGQKIHLGEYDTPEEAALAYNEAAKKYHGEFAWLNEVKV